MAGSVNKAILVGNLGADPDCRTFSSGDEVCNLSIATSESWKDKATGERKSRTEWHRVSILSQGLVKVAKAYLKKGSSVYLEGQIRTRSWEQDGVKKYSTEIVLQGFDAKLVMLDSKGSSNNQNDPYNQDHQAPINNDIEDDSIPF